MKKRNKFCCHSASTVITKLGPSKESANSVLEAAERDDAAEQWCAKDENIQCVSQSPHKQAHVVLVVPSWQWRVVGGGVGGANLRWACVVPPPNHAKHPF